MYFSKPIESSSERGLFRQGYALGIEGKSLAQFGGTIHSMAEKQIRALYAGYLEGCKVSKEFGRKADGGIAAG